MISVTKPDWNREVPRKFWDPSRKLLKTIRLYQKNRQQDGFFASFICKVCVIRHIFWSVVTGADIPLNCKIGGGLLIPHPNGIVIHPSTVIGVNCLIHQQVTFGVNRNSEQSPEIAGHVDIGAGAKIIGPIKIGCDVLVGANAVVVRDVEAGSVVADVPARVIGST